MTLLYIIFFNRQLVFWDLDLKDYQKQSSDVVLNNVRERLHPAAVVLLHDGRRNNSISSAVTVMAARSILQECANRGLTLITVSKALIKGSKKNKK